MRHATLLREFIERWRKESDDFERDGDEGSAASYYNCADELEGVIATLIAELGQEVGAVALGEVVEGEAAGRAISFPNGYSVTLDALAIGTKIYAGSPPSGGEYMAMHWIDRYAAGIDDEPQIDLIRDALTSPAHTSGARDAARYRWLKDRLLCADFSYGQGVDARSVIVFEWPESARISANLDASLDAAMRQEAGSRE